MGGMRMWALEEVTHYTYWFQLLIDENAESTTLL